MRSLISGRRSFVQGLSPSRNFAVTSSRIGGSTVLSAAKHPHDRAGAGIRIVRQQARMALGDMQDDRAGFEQDEIAFLVGGDLAKRMPRQMRGLLHRLERKMTNVAGLRRFFERPAHARIARQSHATIRRAFESGDGGDHGNAPVIA